MNTGWETEGLRVQGEDETETVVVGEMGWEDDIQVVGWHSALRRDWVFSSLWFVVCIVLLWWWWIRLSRSSYESHEIPNSEFLLLTQLFPSSSGPVDVIVGADGGDD